MDEAKRNAIKEYAEGCIASGKTGMMMHCTDVIALCSTDKAPPLPERKRVKAVSREVAA